MTNAYYSPTTLSANTLARASQINQITSALEAAFDKLPAEAALKQARTSYAGATGGTATAYTASLPNTITSYTAGLMVVAKAHAANTGAATLNVDSVGAIAIKRYDGTDLKAGDLSADQIFAVVYDGSVFKLTGQHGGELTATEAAQTAAETAETNAAASASAAATSESNAATSETNAAASETKASQWAGEAEDVEVEPGKYSAYHYAQKAADSASVVDGTVIQDGDGDTSVDTETSADEDKVRIRTGGVERAVIDSSGNLLVGTTSAAGIGTFNGEIAIADGITAPTATSGFAKIFVDSADGNLKVIDADGNDILNTSSGGGALTLLATATAATDSFVAFTSNIDSTYDEYIIAVLSAVPTIDRRSLGMQTSSDGGSTWDTGSSDYEEVVRSVDSGSSVGTLNNANIDAMKVAPLVGNATNETGAQAWIHIIRPSASEHTHIHFSGSATDDTGAIKAFYGAGRRKAASAVNAVRFLFSAGDISSGEFKLYGVKKS
jgi:hypothetical protein